MNPWRRSLARHYCPACGKEAMRVRAPFFDGMAREMQDSFSSAFLAVVLAGSLQRFGVEPGGLSWVVALAVTGMLFYPVADLFVRHKCSGCSHRYAIGDLRSEGWIFVEGPSRSKADLLSTRRTR
ncbi:MAG: hypothetical protein ABWY12_07115 [Burkholderiales bacterium]